jgi:hypothetical protein
VTLTRADSRIRLQKAGDRVSEPEYQLAVESITLAALPTAMSSARSFVVSTLTRWQSPISMHVAIVLTEELVRNAVQTVGVPDPDVAWNQLDSLEVIEIRMLSFEDSIGIEVSDSASGVAADNDELERFDQPLLDVMKAAASRWGCIPTDRGRVVWAQLPTFAHTCTGLPLRPPIPSPRPRTSPEPSRIPGEDLLRRVRDGLKTL